MDIKLELKILCHNHGISIKTLAEKAGMNVNGLHDKCRRKSMTVKDLEKLLAVFNKQLVIKDIDTTNTTIRKDT